MKLTLEDEKCRVKYRGATMKQFGNLHQRMKYVIHILESDITRHSVSNELWHAIHDLQTEVSYHEPKRPPCGRRSKG